MQRAIPTIPTSETMADARQHLTPQRLAVLEVVRRADDHPTAAEIFQRVQSLHPGIAYGTVYTALGALVGMGLVHELTFGDNSSRYDGRLETHHHALCLACGKLEEVELQLEIDKLVAVAKQTAYEITEHHIQFTGYCPACVQRKRPDRSSHRSSSSPYSEVIADEEVVLVRGINTP